MEFSKSYIFKQIIYTFTFLLLNISIFAQSRQISGTVLGEDGLSVIGANVLVKGTANGTTTDLDGKFLLKVSESNTALKIPAVIGSCI